MNELDIQRLKATLLYILSRMPEGCGDVYHVVKTAYYAQRLHFVRYGLPLFKDSIVALQFGPVPSLIYNTLRVSRGETQPYRFVKDDHTLSRLAAVIRYNEENFSAGEAPDMKNLSPSNIDCLDQAIEQVSKMDFKELKDKTHDREWHRAFTDPSNHYMDNINIAREGGASEEMLDYLRDSLEFDEMANGL